MHASMVPSGRAYRTAPPYGPRRKPSSSEISCIARIFGAPVTVPAGKHARRTSKGDTPSRSSPTTSETRCETCENRSTSMLRATCTVPGAADAREVVAPEVDEHHVLGAVLLRREQPLDVALRRLGRARDRAEARAAVLARDEALGRRADERDPVEVEEEEVRRGVDAAQRAVDVERRGGGRPLGALGRDALEDVAGDDVLA